MGRAVVHLVGPADWWTSYAFENIMENSQTHYLPPDVVEPWGSSHGELSSSPHSPGDAVATPQVVIGKSPSEKAKKHLKHSLGSSSSREASC
ncbi:jg13421 [Pararge aegeria aegeria]|uniref:Jg13421 protein n=1 Tax=Pararge aegeria aegeria TaxID=348720 RepID=A0A8S4S0N8_9NEOP|nr:jg13421 [Pararge aegeria aegeria]